MASLSVIVPGNVTALPGSLHSATCRELGNVLVVSSSGWMNKDTRSPTIFVRALRPEFSRRISRVQVNPRNRELSTIRSVPVQVARELLNAGHRFLDVRTPDEFASGHIEGAVNVPYLKSVGGGMTKNKHFVEDVLRYFHKDDEVVVGCWSGRRSLMAAAELQAADFSGVTDMVGGHNAWVQSGLPSMLKA